MESAMHRGDLKQVQEFIQRGTVGVNDHEQWGVDNPLLIIGHTINMQAASLKLVQDKLKSMN